MMAEKRFKQVCECKNCGNEAEMVITCSLEEEKAVTATPHVVPKDKEKPKVMPSAATAAAKRISGWTSDDG